MQEASQSAASRPGPQRRRAASLVAALLLSAAIAGCTGPGTPADALPPAYEVPALPVADAAAALADLQEFTLEHPERRNNVAAHESARAWLLERFASYGLEAWRQDFEHGIPQANVVGIRWGVVRDQVVVVGAHYDTTHWGCRERTPGACLPHATSNGAYDDGSGVTLTLHLAKAFAEVQPYYTIAFVLYDGEERGLQGAAAFAGAVYDGATPLGDAELRAAIDLDMWGIMWPGTNAPTLVLHNSDDLYALFDGARRAMGMPDDMVYGRDTVSLGASDYKVFMAHGVPTIFFSSDFGKVAVPGPAPLYTPAGLYPFWHFQDTYVAMLAMAGGPMALEAGFQSALDLSMAVLHGAATDPAVVLEVSDPEA